MSLKIIPYLLFRLLLQGVFINPTDEKEQINSGENWIQLFNGKDLKHTIHKFQHTFRLCMQHLLEVKERSNQK
jgi:hypothetical protein